MIKRDVTFKLAGLLAALSLTLYGCDGPAPAAVATEAGPAKGPHRGRLLSEGDFQLEVTIYEDGVPPEFRVYAYQATKPLDPADVSVTIEVHRLGGRVDQIAFTKRGDYLLGDKEIYEPHSFEVKAVARWKGQTYRLGYSQVEARVEVGPEARESGGIEIEESGPRDLKNILEHSAELALNPDKVAHVVPRFDGVIMEVRKNLGDAVTRGEVIALLESRELATARQQFIHAVSRRAFRQGALGRAEQLWKKKISPEEDYFIARQALEEAELEVAGAGQTLRALGITTTEVEALVNGPAENLARYEIKAPQDGVVIEKDVALGEAVKEDTDIFVIADLSTVIAKVNIHSRDLKFVRVGQEVRVMSEALGIEAPGTIAYLGPLVGRETRMAKAHVQIPNAEGLWRPGLFATVHLVQGEFSVPVAVRVEAVQQLRDWTVVFLQEGDQFEACPLELGRQSGGWVEVTGGLSAGMKYVSKNSFLIKADILKAGATHDH